MQLHEMEDVVCALPEPVWPSTSIKSGHFVRLAVAEAAEAMNACQMWQLWW